MSSNELRELQEVSGLRKSFRVCHEGIIAIEGEYDVKQERRVFDNFDNCNSLSYDLSNRFILLKMYLFVYYYINKSFAIVGLS